MFSLISGIALFIVAVSAGFFLLFYKNKSVKPASIEALAWFQSLPYEAQQVHLKEKNKRTAKKFTPRWFMEYWRGERSAFSAWMTWVLVGRILFAITAVICLYFYLGIAEFQHFNRLNIPMSIRVSNIIYAVFSGFILWRCAKNSTQEYKYFSRAIAILLVLKLIPLI